LLRKSGGSRVDQCSENPGRRHIQDCRRQWPQNHITSVHCRQSADRFTSTSRISDRLTDPAPIRRKKVADPPEVTDSPSEFGKIPLANNSSRAHADVTDRSCPERREGLRRPPVVQSDLRRGSLLSLPGRYSPVLTSSLIGQHRRNRAASSYPAPTRRAGAEV
jgi:hypothetical protein